MIKFYSKENREKVRRLLDLLLPVIGTELAMFGMNFFDASMSGQAGAAELAGTAMAGNIWMPLRAGMGTALMAGTPIVSQLLGANKREEIPKVIQQGLFLSFFFAFIVIAILAFAAPYFYDYLYLSDDVKHVAIWYGISVGAGVLPFFLAGPLRYLIDSLGYTALTMKIFFMALIVNIFLNYIFIFGWGFVPAYGGIGAGIATGLTYWILFFFFVFCVLFLPKLKEMHIFEHFGFSAKHFFEYLRIGLPMGIGVFLECGVFALTSFLIAKFGTIYIAADMAATNFCTVIYMIPCSISLASTIVIGFEVGAKRFADAHLYSIITLQISFLMALVYIALEMFFIDYVALIYTTDILVANTIVMFMHYGIIWQYFDAVNAPLQGILRGYKDVKFPTLISVVTFWMVCLPYGLFCDYFLNRDAYCYWEGINISLLLSATILFYRLKYIEKFAK